MTYELTEQTFSRIFPKAKNVDKFVHATNMCIPVYKLDTPNRLAMFLAQCGHESGGFTVFEENLNYSADGLRKTFSKYFPDDATASRYARQPQWIASRVYSGRMGNGSEQSKDGWTYRGRGQIQLTGKQNYTNFSKYMYNDDTILQSPDLLLDPYISSHAAGWFWEKGKLNTFSDKDDIIGATRIINGGKNGLEHRTDLYVKIKQILVV